jgi:hypothetical protein
MIDGKQTVGDIADAVCLEFGFELSPELFLPLVDRMVQREAVSVVAGRSPVPSGREDRS